MIELNHYMTKEHLKKPIQGRKKVKLQIKINSEKKWIKVIYTEKELKNLN